MKASEKLELLKNGVKMKEILALEKELEAEEKENSGKEGDQESNTKKGEEGDTLSYLKEFITTSIKESMAEVQLSNASDVDTEGDDEKDNLSSSQKADQMLKNLFERKENK